MIQRIRVVTLVAIAACGGGDRADKPASQPAAPTAAAPAAAKPAPPVEFDLLHLNGAKVAVSSMVANAAIFPGDLVDGKLATAWNSRTGDLVGAWLAVRVPKAAHITRIRMTAGFANVHGKDDWFTMNHRITAVHITRLDVPTDLGVHTLDPAQRGLQDIPIDSPGGDFRIEVTGVVPGTKKAWREICVSELQVWGTFPGGPPRFSTLPDVAVGSLEGTALPDRDITIDPLPETGSLAEYCAAYLALPAETFTGCPRTEEDINCVDQGTRACGEPAHSSIALGALPAGWTSAAYFYTRSEHHKRDTCNLLIAAGGKHYVLEDFGDSSCGGPSTFEDDRMKASYGAELHGDLLALATNAGTVTMGGRTTTFEQLWLCTGREPACSSAIAIGESTMRMYGGGTAGADGLAIDMTGWCFHWKLGGEGKSLVLSRCEEGELPDDALKQLGVHRLVLPSER